MCSIYSTRVMTIKMRDECAFSVLNNLNFVLSSKIV